MPSTPSCSPSRPDACPLRPERSEAAAPCGLRHFPDCRRLSSPVPVRDGWLPLRTAEGGILRALSLFRCPIRRFRSRPRQAPLHPARAFPDFLTAVKPSVDYFEGFPRVPGFMRAFEWRHGAPSACMIVYDIIKKQGSGNENSRTKIKTHGILQGNEPRRKYHETGCV